jgi:hypothetical protein
MPSAALQPGTGGSDRRLSMKNGTGGWPVPLVDSVRRLAYTFTAANCCWASLAAKYFLASPTR